MEYRRLYPEQGKERELGYRKMGRARPISCSQPHFEGMMARHKEAEIMSVKLTYAIKFVDDMDRAVHFYRNTLGLPLKFESPGWSEFVTGEVTLALHPASAKNPPGSVELGFNTDDLEKFHQQMSTRNVQFTMPPTKQDFGGSLAQFLDSEADT